MENIALFGLLALIAECIGTLSGFGSSILFVPIASLFFDFKIVLGITAVFHVFSNISKILLFKKGINKNISLKLGIPAVIFVIIGALLTNYIPIKSIEIVMSVVLIMLAIFLIFNNKYQLEQKDKNLYLGGTISGFLAGLIGTGGAIRGITMIAFNLEKNVFIATSAIIDLGVDSSRAVVYIFSGYFLTEHIKLIPMLIIISIAGTAIGKYFLKYTSQDVFRYVVLVVILLASILQMYKLLG